MLRGRAAILDVQPLLAELAERCGQPGVADNLLHFSSLRYTGNKIPTLVLLSASPEDAPEEESVQGVRAAVLLYEYKLFGVGLGFYTPEDLSGRRCAIAPAAQRASAAAMGGSLLLQRGGHVVQMTFLDESDPLSTLTAVRSALNALRRASIDGEWSLRQREVLHFLPLAETYDKTLAHIGQRTRSNMRYYRRRSERDLGAVFVPEARISLDDLITFNRICSYTVPDDVVRQRYAALSTLSSPFLSGVRDRDGRWLSLISGRRSESAIEIDWQMNRTDLPTYSLVTVMRSYLIEHAIALGCTRLYIDGGTRHPIQFSFRRGHENQLTLMRGSLFAWLFRHLAPRTLRSRNPLSQVVASPAVTWYRW